MTDPSAQCTMWHSADSISKNASCDMQFSASDAGSCECAPGTFKQFKADPNNRPAYTCNTVCDVPTTPLYVEGRAQLAEGVPPGIAALFGGTPARQTNNSKNSVNTYPYRLLSLLHASKGAKVTLSVAPGSTSVIADTTVDEGSGTTYARDLWRNIQISFAPQRFLVQHMMTGLLLRANEFSGELTVDSPTDSNKNDFVFSTNWGDRGIFYAAPGQNYWCQAADVAVMSGTAESEESTYGRINPVLSFCHGHPYDSTWPIGGAPFLGVSSSPTTTGGKAYTVRLSAAENAGTQIMTRSAGLANDWYVLPQYGLTEGSQVPVAHSWSLQQLFALDPAADYTAPFNVARCAVAPRFTDSVTQTEPSQSTKQMLCLSFNDSPVEVASQGRGFFPGLNFKHWQYVDAVIYNAGDQGWAPPEAMQLKGSDANAGVSPSYDGTLFELFDGLRPGIGGRVWVPPPNMINTGHKNGVKVFGYIGFQEIYYGGKFEWWQQFLSDPVKCAHTLVDVCKYYGCDGFFINYESNNPAGDPSLGPYYYTGNPLNETKAYMKTGDNARDTNDYWCHYNPHGEGGPWNPGCNNAPCKRCVEVYIQDGVAVSGAIRKQLIAMFKEFQQYKKQQKYPAAELIWYESMAPDGTINYYGGINSNNIELWQDADGKLADFMFTMIPGGGLVPDQQTSTYNQSYESWKGQQPQSARTARTARTAARVDVGSASYRQARNPANKLTQAEHLALSAGAGHANRRPASVRADMVQGWPKGTGPSVATNHCLQGAGCVCNKDDCRQTPFAKDMAPLRPYDFYSTINISGQDGSTAAPKTPSGQPEQDNWAANWYSGNQTGSNQDSAVEAPLTSLGVFGAESLYQEGFSQEFSDLKAQQFYVGPTNMVMPRNNNVWKPKMWKGLSHYFPEKSTLFKLPWSTWFDTGNGREMYLRGQQLQGYGQWTDWLQDVLPTWRWWPSDTNTPIKPMIAYDDAYNGGACMKAVVPAVLASPVSFRLYKTKWARDNGLLVIVTYKCSGSGVSFGLSPRSTIATNTTPSITYPLPSTGGMWKQVSLTVAAASADEIVTLWLSFAKNTPAQTVRLGGIQVVDAHTAMVDAPPTPSVTIVQKRVGTVNNVGSFNMTWDAPAPQHAVGCYMVFVNGTYNGRIDAGGLTPRAGTLSQSMCYNVQGLQGGKKHRVALQPMTVDGGVHRAHEFSVSVPRGAHSSGSGSSSSAATRALSGLAISSYVVGGSALVLGVSYGVSRRRLSGKAAAGMLAVTLVLAVTAVVLVVAAFTVKRTSSLTPLAPRSPASTTSLSATRPHRSRMVRPGFVAPLLQQARADVAAESARMAAYARTTLKDEDLARCIEVNYMLSMQYLSTIPGEGRTFMYTGGWAKEGPGPRNFTLMGGMWTRDSCATYHSYVPLAVRSPSVCLMVEGLVRQACEQLLYDSYANAFNPRPDYTNSWVQGHNGYVQTRNYEPDGMCYLLWLAHALWKETGTTGHLDELFKIAADKIVVQLTIEQHRAKFQSAADPSKAVQSVYRFNELENGGVGTYIADIDADGIGMTWTAFRASDDPTLFGWHVPNNMFAVSALQKLCEMLRSVPYFVADRKAQRIETAATQLAASIDNALVMHATYEHATFGPIYAYEVDALFSQPFTNVGVDSGSDAPAPLTLTVPKGVVLHEDGLLTRVPCEGKHGKDSKCNTATPVGNGLPKTPGGSVHLNVLVNGKPLAWGQYSFKAPNNLTLNKTPPAGSSVLVKGNYNLMDDANVPSLLSIPYIGYTGAAWNPSVYANTRKFVLSAQNRWFYGKGAGVPATSTTKYSGVGSPHTFLSAGPNMVWPMAINMAGLTALTKAEKEAALQMAVRSATDISFTNNNGSSPSINGNKDQSRYYMHESFNIEDPNYYTRGTFGWSAAVFAELFVQLYGGDMMDT